MIKRSFFLGILILTLGFPITGYSTGETPLNDASGMFNERGFRKSNSVDISGKEIVSNFNGNLMYNRTLFEIPGRGDLDLKVTLTYNGSVPHSSANLYGPYQYIYSVNAPEWILGVNGIAVQVLNFENMAYNIAQSADGHVQGNDVSMLISGYHICSRLSGIGGEVKDDVRFLMSDGSVEDFYNSTLPPSWDGVYLPNTKNSYSKGYMAGTDVGERQFYLKRGDGTTIVYQEMMPNYHLGLQSLSHAAYQPKLFYPLRIEDRYGNAIEFTYDTDVDAHPILTGVTANWGLTAEFTFNKLGGEVTIGGNTYTFSTIWGTFERAMIDTLTDPVGRITAFRYESYGRIAENLHSEQITTDEDWTFWTAGSIKPTLFRINSITYPDGGKVKYTYFDGDGNPNTQITLSIPENPDHQHTPSVKSDYFQDCGRDPFFINMVKTRVLWNWLDNDSVETRKDNFTYSWIDDGDNSWYDAYDEFFTDVTKRSAADPTEFVSIRYKYKNCPHDDKSTDYYKDSGWSIKLVNTREKVRSPNVYRTVDYSWHLGDLGSQGYDGSFLLKTKTVTEDDNSYTWDYDYTLDGINIAEKIETNPLGVVDTTKYLEDYFSVIDQNSLYLIELLDWVKVTEDEVLKSKNKYEYYSSGLNGYDGQLHEKKEYLVVSGAAQDLITTTYTYYKHQEPDNDNGEGNLKTVADPNGNLIKYYYLLPETLHCGGPAPKYNVQYEKVYNDGTVQTCCEDFSSCNQRFFIKKEQFNCRGDTLSIYRHYDDFGNVLMEVDENGYLTKYIYDDLTRIERVIKPGDFSHTLDDPNEFTTRYSYDDEPNDGDDVSTLIVQKQASDDTVSTEYHFDGFGRLDKVDKIKNDGSRYSTAIGYNYLGLREFQTDPQNHTTSYEYDLLQRLTKTKYIDAGPDSVCIIYSNASAIPGWPPDYGTVDYVEVKMVFDENNHKTVYYSDALGRLRAVEKYIGNDAPDLYSLYSSTFYDYDALGNLISVMDPQGHELTYQYDSLKRLKQKTDPDAGTTKFRYDKNGNLIFKQDAVRAANSQYGWIYYKYDPLNRLIEEGLLEAAPGSEPNYTFPEKCKHLFIHDRENMVNSKSRLSQAYSYDFQYGVKYNYDPRGRLFNKINLFDAQVTFDTKIVTVSVSVDQPHTTENRTVVIDHNQVVNYTLIAHGEGSYARIYKNSDLVDEAEGSTINSSLSVVSEDTIKIQAQTAHYPVSAYAQLIYEKYDLTSAQIVGDEYPIGYTYDKADNLTSLTYPDNSIVKYTYNSLGQVDSVTNGESTVYATYTYWPNGQIESICLGNGVTENYTYTPRDWVDLLASEPGNIIDLDYGYDNVGNVTSINDYNDQDRNLTFLYDELNRLETGSCNLWSRTFTYDPNGNRQTMNSTDYTYGYETYDPGDGVNRLVDGGGTTYTYDSNGNLIFKTNGAETETLTYEYLNRLTKAITSEAIDSFAYDPDGRRVMKIYQSTVPDHPINTIYVRDGLDVIYEEKKTINRPPVLNHIGNKAFYKNRSYSFTVTGSDPDGDNLHYYTSSLPPGATFDVWIAGGQEGGGIFSWTPTSNGTSYVWFYVTDGELTDSEEVQMTVTTYNPPPPSCPYLYLWDGSSYVKDNDVIPASQNREYVDYYLLQGKLVPEGDRYSLKIVEEMDEISYLDRISLIQVDHPQGTKIAPGPEGEIYTYQNPVFPLSAEDSKGQDVLSSMETGGLEAKAGDYLSLDFGQVEGADEGGRLIVGMCTSVPQEPCIWPVAGMEAYNNQSGQWEEVAVFGPREEGEIRAVDLSEILKENSGELKVKITWKVDYGIRYVMLDTSAQSSVTMTTLPLLSAVHSRKEDVSGEISASDNLYARTRLGDVIELQFPYYEQGGDVARDFILVTEGYYTAADSAEEEDAAAAGDAPVTMSSTISGQTCYIYAGARRIAKVVDGQVYYYICDHLGSVRVITDELGNAKNVYDYYPFGSIQNQTEAISNRHKFTGKELDNPTALYYFGARYYDPEIGRFITPDPSGPNFNDPQTLNPYVYCLNNPLRYVDPDGREATTSLGLLVYAMMKTAKNTYIGLACGLASQAVKDIKRGELSGWEAYAGSGGAGLLVGGIMGWATPDPVIDNIIAATSATGVSLIAGEVIGEIATSLMESKGKEFTITIGGKTYVFDSSKDIVKYKGTRVTLKAKDGSVITIDKKGVSVDEASKVEMEEIKKKED